MASTALTAAQLAYRAADKPLLVAKHDYADATVIARSTNQFAIADQSDSDNPTADCLNRSRTSKMVAGTAYTSWYVLGDGGAVGFGGITGDCIIIEGHNFSGKAITVKASDTLSAGFLASPTTLDSWTPGDNTRQVRFWDTYYGFRYWEIGITGTSWTPEAIQIWVGQQIQLGNKARMPFDDDARTGIWGGRAVTRSGSVQTVVSTARLSRLSGKFYVVGTGMTTDVREAHVHTSAWAKPFWYVENPDASPEDALLAVHADPELALQAGKTEAERQLLLDAVEVGPRIT